MASTSRAPESESDSRASADVAAQLDRRGARASGRALLAGGTPREVLARLVAGDPLELRARVAAALASEALFVDPDRAFLRAAAHVARFAPRYRGQPDLDAWLEARVLAALRELAEEARESSVHGREVPAALVELAAKLKLEPAALARACAALNACERLERRAFRALVIEARELDVAARALESTPSETGRAARRALEVALAALGTGGVA